VVIFYIAQNSSDENNMVVHEAISDEAQDEVTELKNNKFN
jgi:hypothetical protein